MARNLVLIGFMGSGKSTIGAHLAQNLDRFLLDTDLILQSTFSLSIDEFFIRYGEAEFRKQEGKLVEWLSTNAKDVIIATGGGMPIFHNVRQMGMVVFLSLEFEEILMRLDSTQIAKRPLFKDKNQAYELFLERKEFYKKSADIIINANQTKEQIVKEILESEIFYRCERLKIQNNP